MAKATIAEIRRHLQNCRGRHRRGNQSAIASPNGSMPSEGRRHFDARDALIEEATGNRRAAAARSTCRAHSRGGGVETQIEPNRRRQPASEPKPHRQSRSQQGQHIAPTSLRAKLWLLPT